MLITNPEKLPGFKNPLTKELLTDADVFKNLFDGYSSVVNIRRYKSDWTVSFVILQCFFVNCSTIHHQHLIVVQDDVKKTAAANVKQFFEETDNHWNVIDADARNQPITDFGIPDGIREASVHEVRVPGYPLSSCIGCTCILRVCIPGMGGIPDT